MGEYVSDFGITRYVGRGEGRDTKYDASAKPALGTENGIEVVVDENGPLPNKGTGYGNGQAKIPAGSFIKDAVLFVEKAGSASGVTLSIVKKDGSDAVALLAATTPTDNSTVVCAGAAISKSYAQDRYIKVGGTVTGLKAKLVVTFM